MDEAYVVEGQLEIGPEELPLIFEGEGLGGLLSYYWLGRVAVERLEE